MRQTLFFVLFLFLTITVALHAETAPGTRASDLTHGDTGVPMAPERLQARVIIPAGISAERIATALQPRDLALVSMSCTLPDFSATYVASPGEEMHGALVSFAADIQHIHAELRANGIAPATTDTEVLAMALPHTLHLRDILVEGTAAEIAAFAASAGGSVEEPRAPRTRTDSATRPIGSDASISTDATITDSFAPSTGSISYYPTSKELWSNFSWKDIAWTTAYGKVGYEHDLAVLGGLNDFVRYGSGTYASNLPNVYLDDPTYDDTTILSFLSYPATVTANTPYFVRIPVQVVNASLGPRALNLTPQLVTLWNNPIELGYCTSKGFATPSCVFADSTVNTLRYYQDKSASSPVYSRVNFDVGSSWTYYWDRSFDFTSKTCSGSYLGEYYNDVNPQGTARYVRCDNAINFSWGLGGPGLGIRSDQFSVRWTKQAYFNAGTYSVSAQSDDGIRVWIDNVQRLDAWREGGTPGWSASYPLTSGNHSMKVEYYENAGAAKAIFDMRQAATTPVTVLSEGAESGAPGWSFSSSGGSPWMIETSTASYAGSRRFRLGSGASYANFTNASLTSPSFSLVGRNSATATFSYKYDTESGYDFFWAEISPDGGATWSRLTPTWSGLSPSGAYWDRATYTLGSSALGKSNVKIRFRFTSDASVIRWGAAIDAISVVAQ